MWTDKQFWLDSSWRAFRTFCQTLAALLGGQAVDALTAPWASMLSVAGTAALVSLLMSVDRERAVGGIAPGTAQPEAAEVPAAVPVIDTNPAAADYIPAAYTALR